MGWVKQEQVVSGWVEEEEVVSGVGGTGTGSAWGGWKRRR